MPQFVVEQMLPLFKWLWGFKTTSLQRLVQPRHIQMALLTFTLAFLFFGLLESQCPTTAWKVKELVHSFPLSTSLFASSEWFNAIPHQNQLSLPGPIAELWSQLKRTTPSDTGTQHISSSPPPPRERICSEPAIETS